MLILLLVDYKQLHRVWETPDTGGDGANFVVAIESESDSISPLIETIMIGTFSNKAFSFTSDSIVIEDSKKEAYFTKESR